MAELYRFLEELHENQTIVIPPVEQLKSMRNSGINKIIDKGFGVFGGSDLLARTSVVVLSKSVMDDPGQAMLGLTAFGSIRGSRGPMKGRMETFKLNCRLPLEFAAKDTGKGESGSTTVLFWDAREIHMKSFNRERSLEKPMLSVRGIIEEMKGLSFVVYTQLWTEAVRKLGIRDRAGMERLASGGNS